MKKLSFLKLSVLLIMSLLVFSCEEDDEATAEVVKTEEEAKKTEEKSDDCKKVAFTINELDGLLLKIEAPSAPLEEGLKYFWTIAEREVGTDTKIRIVEKDFANGAASFEYTIKKELIYTFFLTTYSDSCKEGVSNHFVVFAAEGKDIAVTKNELYETATFTPGTKDLELDPNKLSSAEKVKEIEEIAEKSDDCKKVGFTINELDGLLLKFEAPTAPLEEGFKYFWTITESDTVVKILEKDFANGAASFEYTIKSKVIYNIFLTVYNDNCQEGASTHFVIYAPEGKELIKTKNKLYETATFTPGTKDLELDPNQLRSPERLKEIEEASKM